MAGGHHVRCRREVDRRGGLVKGYVVDAMASGELPDSGSGVEADCDQPSRVRGEAEVSDGRVVSWKLSNHSACVDIHNLHCEVLQGECEKPALPL